MSNSRYINYDGVDIEVYFYWQPAEAQTLEYPGCPETIEIQEITRDGDDVTIDYSQEEIEEIELQILNERYEYL